MSWMIPLIALLGVLHGLMGRLEAQVADLQGMKSELVRAIALRESMIRLGTMKYTEVTVDSKGGIAAVECGAASFHGTKEKWSRSIVQVRPHRVPWVLEENQLELPASWPAYVQENGTRTVHVFNGSRTLFCGPDATMRGVWRGTLETTLSPLLRASPLRVGFYSGIRSYQAIVESWDLIFATTDSIRCTFYMAERDREGRAQVLHVMIARQDRGMLVDQHWSYKMSPEDDASISRGEAAVLKKYTPETGIVLERETVEAAIREGETWLPTIVSYSDSRLRSFVMFSRGWLEWSLKKGKRESEEHLYDVYRVPLEAEDARVEVVDMLTRARITLSAEGVREEPITEDSTYSSTGQAGTERYLWFAVVLGIVAFICGVGAWRRFLARSGR